MSFKPNGIIHVALDLATDVIKVGRMAQKQNQIWFEFDPEFIDKGLDISPFHLHLASGLVAAKYQPFDGLFGVFNDSLPDGWGKLLLDRALTAKGIAFQSLTPLDRLAYVGRRGMGALVYYPEIETDGKFEGTLDLNQLSDEVVSVLEGDAINTLDRLYTLGGSSAGARPKIVAAYNPTESTIMHGSDTLPPGFQHWLIKFPSSSDLHDIAMIEFAYSLMAKNAGLEMTETKLFQGSKGRMYFGTQRFDRDKNNRLHMHTAAGLLHADHRIPNLDYAVLMNALLKLNNDVREVEKLFRLAVFNVLAHNRDDHSKNFSFLMDPKGKWRLAPAYDLTFSYGPARQHATTILREGLNPTKEHLLKLGEMFGIKDRKSIIEEVRESVSRWVQFADESGVTKSSTTMVQKNLAL
jgi:serine/threonine-protein kinase HipA